MKHLIARFLVTGFVFLLAVILIRDTHPQQRGRASTSWYPVDAFWPSLAVSCITYDPVDTETFYLGTGEGDGLYRSVDGGQSWGQVYTDRFIKKF